MNKCPRVRVIWFSSIAKKHLSLFPKRKCIIRLRKKSFFLIKCSKMYGSSFFYLKINYRSTKHRVPALNVQLIRILHTRNTLLSGLR